MGRNNGTIMFVYQTYDVKDRITITYENRMIFDSGCVGTEDEQQTPVTFSGQSQELRVDVEPNCDGTTSTGWYFSVPCLPVCSSSKDNSMVHLMSDQTPIQDGGTIYITDEPQMPPLTATYCVDPNTPTTINWNFKLDYNYVVCKNSAAGHDCSVKYNRNCSFSYQNDAPTWDIIQEFGAKISGGSATLTWNDSNSNSGTIRFKILGTNPSRSAVQNYISSQSPPWYSVYIAQWESRYIQFDTSTKLPMHSFDFGYGLYQLTVPEPKCDDLWNWKFSVDTGITVIYQKVSIASDWMIRQRGQAFNDTGHAVPIPCHKVQNCVFQEGTNEVIDDAVAIKAFNGATHHYCAWNNAQKCWYFVEKADNQNDYVKDVCGELPSTSNSCPSPDPYAGNLCP
uniref:Uncharacterized protein n=1 Tax=Panagrolaimus davidi TaxID=227884 RepID=A0A914PMU7_9BILA